WTQARTLCQIHYKDLATITSTEENNRYFQLGTNYFGSWIGLNKLSGSWKWSGGEAVQEWNHGFDYYPNTSENGYDCVLEFDRGLWMKDYCGNWRAFYCYRFLILVKENKTWNEAQEFCRNNYTDLATINSVDENNRCFQTGQIYFGGWTGLRKISGSWTWSDGQALQKWYNDSNSYIDYPTLDDFCVHMANGGYWLSDYCGYGKNFYCYRFLILVMEKKTWDEAQNWCKSNYTGLASLTSEASLRQLKLETAQTETVNVWTGLRFRNGNWSWVSGEPLGSLVLANRSCPVMTDSCGSLNTISNTINNQNCMDKLNFVCYLKDIVQRRSLTREYIFVNFLTNWYHAQYYCRYHYNDLATITSEVENKRCFQSGNSYFGTWTGLRRTSGSWRWSDGGSFLNFNNGLNSYIDNPKYDGYCVHTSYQGLWLNDFCWYGKNFYCYRVEFGVAEGLTRKYIFVDSNVLWRDAQTYCRTYYKDLATITSMEEKISCFESVSGGGSWIGLKRTWSDGEQYAFPNWCNGKPFYPDSGYDCGSIAKYHPTFWVNYNCKDKRKFLCYREYTFINSITDWASAKTFCRNNHTGLANVTSSVENKRLIKSGSGSEGWLGLQVNITTWNDSDPTYLNWCRGCPSKYVKCVFTDTEGFWNTGFCLNKKSFYCYRFLALVKIKMTWEEAQDHCRAKYTGLASVISEASLRQVIEESAQTQTENVWTGLSFINGMW
ncbi:secretory phospholipase A2 receptor-like, partial [Silurus asotus]